MLSPPPFMKACNETHASKECIKGRMQTVVVSVLRTHFLTRITAAIVLLLVMLPYSVGKVHSINCSLYDDPLPIPHKYYQPGDFVIGEIVSQVFLFQDSPSFTEVPTQMSIGEPVSVPKNYQHILALLLAVKEINENPQILPNISLGFHILNSYYVARKTYKASLSLLSTQHRFVPNYKCDTQSKLIAVIGGLATETSANMASIFATYKIPQVRHIH
ncbi:vomeronasal type-2 receptor 26-like [Podarcis muralis]